ncbi:phage head morphogenesis protein [Spirosoma lituiforme]
MAELQTLYGSHQHDTLTLADGSPLPKFLNIKKLVGKALDNLFNGFKGLIEPSLFAITYQAMNDAVDKGFGVIKYGEPNYEFVQQLKKSGAWFSARKTYRQREELAALLTDEKGKVRTWRQFKAASQSIVSNYNEVWLKVEYNTAIASARNASRWKQFEADADQYPNLEYLPSRAATPREEHKPYYHVIRPINDEFWVHHFPPSAYNCQCGVEQSDDDETPVPEKGPQPVPGLDHNVGKTGELFSKSHPYSVDLSKEQQEEIDDEGEKLADDDGQ